MPVETGLGRPPVQLEHRRLVRLVAKALRAHLARNCGRCFVRGWLQNSGDDLGGGASGTSAWWRRLESKLGRAPTRVAPTRHARSCLSHRGRRRRRADRSVCVDLPSWRGWREQTSG
eukprot:scaffold34397_cov58-Phaeocystis_antarctica.AAC.4